MTGGAGFIGCAISQLLAPGAARFVVLDNLHPQVHPTPERPARLHPSAELVIGDVTEAGTWDRLLSDFAPTTVIHLAAETGTGQSLSEASRHGRVNVVGTTEMMDAFTRQEVFPSHVVLSSSRAVYGEGSWEDSAGRTFYPGQRSHQQLVDHRWDFPESRPLPSRAAVTQPQPTSVYAATKLAQEHLLSAWALASSVDLTILRLQNVFGPGQSLTNSYTGIVALFSQMAAAGDPIPLYEDGEVTRDFVYIEDVAKAFEAAVTGQGVRGGGVVRADIGSGAHATIKQLAEALADFYGSPPPIITGQFRDGDVRHARCEIDEAEDKLGWTPTWDLIRGLTALQQFIGPPPG